MTIIEAPQLKMNLCPHSSNVKIEYGGLPKLHHFELEPENIKSARKGSNRRIAEQFYKAVLCRPMNQNTKTLKCAERKYQICEKRVQSAHCRAFLRSSSLSPNESKREDAEGKSEKAMNQTKGRIAECIGDPD
ncbi:hypothetical protein H5410_021589 [Solanum commersonii]|uniref:Uncharacterized protein n=1 Tax=Solanum commersonii TaxID=4109 RepID=A0A9J5ZFQ8_SOLCO|nr:hypothetical protein H5410_021589 [Solanum commersonii]